MKITKKGETKGVNKASQQRKFRQVGDGEEELQVHYMAPQGGRERRSDK